MLSAVGIVDWQAESSRIAAAGARQNFMVNVSLSGPVPAFNQQSNPSLPAALSLVCSRNMADFSHIGNLLSGPSGIQELMDDLGEALSVAPDMRMLGGGNPAAIPQMQALWRGRMARQSWRRRQRPGSHRGRRSQPASRPAE